MYFNPNIAQTQYVVFFLEGSFLLNWCILVFIALSSYPASLYMPECWALERLKTCLFIQHEHLILQGSIFHCRQVQTFSAILTYLFAKQVSNRLKLSKKLDRFFHQFFLFFICFYSPTTWLFLFIALFFLLLLKTTCLSPGNCRIYAGSSFKDVSIQKFSGEYCSPLMCVALSAKIRKPRSERPSQIFLFLKNIF